MKNSDIGKNLLQMWASCRATKILSFFTPHGNGRTLACICRDNDVINHKFFTLLKEDHSSSISLFSAPRPAQAVMRVKSAGRGSGIRHILGHGAH
jgi:hypothetical protein